MGETPIADRLAAMTDAELIENAARGAAAESTNYGSQWAMEIERRLTELDRKINHVELTPEIVAWLAEVAKRGAITGQYSLASFHPLAPMLQWTIFPDGKMWLQICDMNMAPIWRMTLTGPGKIPDGG